SRTAASPRATKLRQVLLRWSSSTADSTDRATAPGVRVLPDAERAIRDLLLPLVPHRGGQLAIPATQRIALRPLLRSRAKSSRCAFVFWLRANQTHVRFRAAPRAKARHALSNFPSAPNLLG